MAERGGVMLCPAIWRCACRFVVFLPLVLFAGHAAGQSPRCLNPSVATAPGFAAEPEQTPPAPLETPIWKTITIGGSRGVNAIRLAMETAPCLMLVGDNADEILGRPAFPYIKAPVELDLVVLSVFDLGFDDRASLQDIYARAVARGLELCPAEVGPALRLYYLDQSLGEFLHIAMRPVARYTGELVDFSVGNAGAGLLLIGGDGYPDVMVSGGERFVFVRPKPIPQNDPSPKR
jgi:hypothetical protein